MDWKKLIQFVQNDVLGLDIGSSSVKVVQLRNGDDGFKVTAAAKADIAVAADGDTDSKRANIVNAVDDCLNSSGIKTRLAVCGISGPEVAVRHFKFPALGEEEIQGAIMLEANQVCPFNIDDCALDYHLIPEDQENTSGVLVAATNKLVEEKKEIAKLAGLDAALVDVDGLALLNCFEEYEKRSDQADAGQTIAILNVGNSFTNLAIVGENSVPFIRDISYAGQAIIQQIANVNNVSKETVANLLAGHDDPGADKLDLTTGLIEACKKLIVDVTDTLRYYTTQEKSTVVEKIFVCGSFSLVEGFIELLDDQLPADVVLWNPFDKIPCSSNSKCKAVLEKIGPELVVATGLAMRSLIAESSKTASCSA